MLKFILLAIAFIVTGCQTSPPQEQNSVSPAQTREPQPKGSKKTECEKAKEAIKIDSPENCLGTPEDCYLALENSEQRTNSIIAANEICLKEASGTLEADVKNIKP